MKLETLVRANQVARQLERWKDIDMRLSCGDGFGRILFKAEKNKTMTSEFEYFICDEGTINAFKVFVGEQIKECLDEIEQM